LSGQIYSLENLFKPGSDYVQKINEILLAQIKEIGEEMGVWEGSFTGISPEPLFVVTADALKITFSVYEIAPYAAGFPTFAIPYAEIMDLIDTEGALWKAFHM
jgi:hypothetical protein